MSVCQDYDHLVTDTENIINNIKQVLESNKKQFNVNINKKTDIVREVNSIIQNIKDSDKPFVQSIISDSLGKKIYKDYFEKLFVDLTRKEEKIDGIISNVSEYINNEIDISNNKKLFKEYKLLLKKLKDTGDASEPRSKVRKQLLHNKYLLASIYLIAILGGSYYIYRYFKK
tara:strand:- start:1653 stop:2168 length:516 start_codon:yes stop_codon:yes gene_type:complete